VVTDSHGAPPLLQTTRNMIIILILSITCVTYFNACRTFVGSCGYEIQGTAPHYQCDGRRKIKKIQGSPITCMNYNQFQI
jgi:hypothetical protein